MLFKIILNYIFGYANIEIEGYYIERFINTCMKNGIFLWGIKRKMSTMLYAKIGATDLEEATDIAKKHQCLISVKGKKGLPFLIDRYKNRKVFLVALFMLIAIIFTLSKFIWNVEVTGNTKIDANEILAEVKKQGLRIGTLKSKVDVDSIVNKIRLERDDLAWIGIDLKGTNAIIKIVEAEEKPEIVDESEFSNIVAKKDGEIVKVTAQNGTIIVQEGDLVKKGDIIIAGYMEGKHTDRYYVNSSGSVKAKIKYSQSEKIEKKEVKREQTGKKDEKLSIKINNFKINFYKRLSKFKNYDTIYSSKKLALFSNFYLPVEFIKSTNYEVNEIEVMHDYEEAKSIGEKAAKEKLDSLIEGEQVSSNTEVTEYVDYYNVTVTYEVIEEIGTKEKIIF